MSLKCYGTELRKTHGYVNPVVYNVIEARPERDSPKREHPELLVEFRDLSGGKHFLKMPVLPQ